MIGPLTKTRRSLVLRRVLVSGPITALAAVSPRRKGTIFRRRTSGPCGGRDEGPQGRNGSATSLRCLNVGPYHNQPLTGDWKNLKNEIHCAATFEFATCEEKANRAGAEENHFFYFLEKLRQDVPWLEANDKQNVSKKHCCTYEVVY